MKNVGCFGDRIFYLLTKGLRSSDADCDMQNMLAILDLRPERTIDVVISIACAFSNSTSIGYDGERRLCGVDWSNCKLLAFSSTKTLVRRLHNQKTSVIVVWRGPIRRVFERREQEALDFKGDAPCAQATFDTQTTCNNFSQSLPLKQLARLAVCLFTSLSSLQPEQ